MLSRVIIAIEDTKFAQAIEKQLSQIKWPDSTVFRVVHVIEPSDTLLAWPSEELRAEAMVLLDSIASNLRRLFPNAHVEEVVLNGHAGEVIIEDAVSWQADLVVAGSHGKRGLRRFMLGSVAAAISNNSPCSVLIIRPEHEAKKEEQLALSEGASV
ncbi:universal stress protein [Candidatus Obscuribacterales bacterium]|nr:universal stress protein [Candidatus Obscuribacterales bacterium]